MDFSELLSVARSNKVEARSESSVKRYSTVLPPPKKVSRNGIQSDAIKQFLARKQAEEHQKAEEAQRKKEELLRLRSQSTKNNKKAKIMASRTKDNDFSKIKLTEDEQEAKKQRELELLRLDLNNKVERMKARIEMEEREKLLPRKRKRKHKKDEAPTDDNNNFEEEEQEEEEEENYSEPALYQDHNSSKLPSKNDLSNREKVVKKPPRPPPPSFSFHDLLQVAAKKQYEPVKLPEVKDDDGRPLTKKARRLLLEEENRVRRKLAAEAAEKEAAKSTANPQPNEMMMMKQLPKITFKKKKPLDEREIAQSVEKSHKRDSMSDKGSGSHRTDKPIKGNREGINHKVANESNNQQKLAKRVHSQNASIPKSSLPTQNSNEHMSQSVPKKQRVAHQPSAKRQENIVSNSQCEISKNVPSVTKSNERKCEHLSARAKESLPRLNRSQNEIPVKSKSTFVSKNNNIENSNLKKENVAKGAFQGKGKPKADVNKNNGSSTINDQMIAEVERRVREEVEKKLRGEMENAIRNQMEKEFREKLSQRKVNMAEKSNTTAVPTSKEMSGQLSKPQFRTKGIPNASTLNEHKSKTPFNLSNKGAVRPNGSVVNMSQVKPNMIRPEMTKKPMKSLPEKVRKPAFHPNPYLQPPRRLLESHRPQKPQRQRLESDDDDDEDDDMSDFIDDGLVADQDDDYSKYIKEIFHYDRDKYIDDDDDDIIETSYVDQEKEERQSAKIAYLEDLEEQRKEEEEKKRKMMKKMRKSKK